MTLNKETAKQMIDGFKAVQDQTEKINEVIGMAQASLRAVTDGVQDPDTKKFMVDVTQTTEKIRAAAGQMKVAEVQKLHSELLKRAKEFEELQKQKKAK